MVLSEVTTEYYKLKEDMWISGPTINRSRNSHSSCSIGSKVYIFGGLDDTSMPVSSLESLDVVAFLNNNEDVNKVGF